MGHYILAIDNGTTGTTAALIDSESFAFIDKVNQEYKQYYPRPGLVEHDANEIWGTVEKTISTLLKNNNISGKNIVSIGITNQRETCVAFDNNGNPYYHALVWQDRRTQDFCLKIQQEGKAESIRSMTGLPPDPYFSATKMKWLIENVPQVSDALKNKKLKFGTVDCFLLYKLSGGTSHATEASNASRTLLMNLKTCQWDSNLQDIFNVPTHTLPRIESSFGEFGKTKGLAFLPDGIPISGILGDQQAALFGQACVNAGEIKSTYGTGAFLLMNTGNEVKRSAHGLLTTVAYKNGSNIHYALEGSVYVAGAAVQYLRDNLKFFKSSSEIEEIAKKSSLTSMENIIYLPFFTGAGTPYWKSDAKGAIVGLTRDTGISEISRACLEGIALSINDCINSFTQDLGSSIKELKVDGGAAANNFLMELQASFSNVTVIRPKVLETTAYGAALAAAVGRGLIKINEIKNHWNFDKSFEPDSKNAVYWVKKKNQWNSYINRLFLNTNG